MRPMAPVQAQAGTDIYFNFDTSHPAALQGLGVLYRSSKSRSSEIVAAILTGDVYFEKTSSFSPYMLHAKSQGKCEAQ